MTTFRVLHQVARADFLERTRRHGFVVTLLAALYLGYAAASGTMALQLGEYRGVYTSGWIGVNVAVLGTAWITLAGFFVVRNAIAHDGECRIGEIVAATPVGTLEYLVGKWLSNTAVLAAQVAVLAAAAVTMYFVIGERPPFDLWALTSPFLFLAMPAVALTAALALAFETIPLLRSGAGNVGWVLLWSFGMGLPAATGAAWLDPAGMFAVMNSLVPAGRAVIPGYDGGFGLQVSLFPAKVATGLVWDGLRWDLWPILLRLQWVVVAFGVVLVARAFFHRFDPARARRPAAAGPAPQPAAAGNASEAWTDAERHRYPAGRWSAGSLTRCPPRHSLLGMFAAELRLLRSGCRWWWYAVALGLVAAQALAPLDWARGPILAAAWIWPLLLWSELGARESAHGTREIVFSAARILPVHLPATWLAGLTVAAATGAGAAVRMAVAGERDLLLAWAAGALFIPSLALALGVWTGSRRPFEAAFTCLWYVGPLNRVPGFDFTGFANAAHLSAWTASYLTAAAVLLVLAVYGRGRLLYDL